MLNQIKYRNLVFGLIFIVLPIIVNAQSYSSQQIELAERLQTLAKNAAPEIAYIQTSKDIYETGEDLWFKVYLLDAQLLVPSLRSKTLYFQLINENTGKINWQEKYEIKNGFADGRVYLQSTLPEGDYFLAAYTPNSFFNDSTEFKAVKLIKIVNDIGSVPEQGNAENRKIKQIHPEIKKIQFTTFPEGGNLISGILNKLAYKAVNRNGEPVEISGTLFADNIPIKEFKSIHAGMGSFEFTPDARKKYLIRLTDPAIDSVFTLPEIYPTGIVMQLVRRDKESLSFKVIQSPGVNPYEIFLRVQARGVVYAMTSATLNHELKLKVPLSGLPQGIAEVTLFNSNLMPVAERLIYINQNHKLNITAELSNGIYPTRGKVNMKISVKDENGDPVIANLGISAFDKIYQDPRDSNNILTHYYLSTQIKGRIYNPSYYFNVKNKDRLEELDLLMLTQGWRKYIWNEENLKESVNHREQVIFDGIKGEVFFTGRKKKIPKEHTFVMAFSPNKDSTNLLITADSVGRFEVLPHEFKRWENDYVYLKPFGKYNYSFVNVNDPLAQPEHRLVIRLEDPYEVIKRIFNSKEIIYPFPGMFYYNEDSIKSGFNYSGTIKIKEITIKGQKAKIIRGKYMGLLDSVANSLSKPTDWICYWHVLNCPNHDEHYPGSHKPYLNEECIKIYCYNTPAVMYKKIIYHPPVIPRFTEEQLLKINNLSRIKAYYGNREFYKPDYDKMILETNIPDFRNTLLWEPSVITDKNGEATLSFFCSDINTDFVGRIEGVGGEGLLGTGFFKFTVRKLK
jgi:hypothetical protein